LIKKKIGGRETAPVLNNFRWLCAQTNGGNMKRTSFWLAASLFLFAACPGLEYVHGSERAKYFTIIESLVKDSQFVAFLRNRGVKMETDANGLLRIYVHGKPDPISVIVKFLRLMETRQEVILKNLVNVDTARDAGGNPYRRKIFSIDKDGNAWVVNDERTPLSKRYLPEYPYADKDGYVNFPNIDLHKEMIELQKTEIEYLVAAALLERCLPDNYISSRLIQASDWNLEHLRENREILDRLDRIEQKLDALKSADNALRLIP
jgi:flagellar basal-body rod protein FlgC